MKSPLIRAYTSRELSDLADQFFREYWTLPPKIPVEIEPILEKSGFNLVPHPGLRRNYRTEGVLVYDRITKKWSIWFDEALLDFEPRYRFTLAEEMSHYLLHKDIFLAGDTVEDCIEIYASLNNEEYHSIERNAKHLAAKLLIPAEDFKSILRTVIPRKLAELGPDVE